MNSPTEIRYPRHEAKFKVVKSRREPMIAKRIAEIEASAIYCELIDLREELSIVQSGKLRFTCWNCASEHYSKDLTLYNFFTRGDEYNHDRCDDYNLVCPKCGAFSIVDAKSEVYYAAFKTREEIEQ